MDTTNTDVTHEEITSRAHVIWERQGRPTGRSLEHWLQAERELQQEKAQQSSLVSAQIPLKEGATESAANPTVVQQTRAPERAAATKRAGRKQKA